jgi:hypothetical protein
MDGNSVLERLLEILWIGYKRRVPYAARYQTLVEEKGGRVQNDHIAFRTFNCHVGAQPAGVAAIARIFEALGYQKKDRYVFTDKKLTAWHWEHQSDLSKPKIFISQLEVQELPATVAAIVRKTVGGSTDLISRNDKVRLQNLSQAKNIDSDTLDKLAQNLAGFFLRPWEPPRREDVEDVNKISQYAAWTLLHGNSVNHFTAYINEQNVGEWPDLEATVNALREAGLPMKQEFEGERGSKLRQSSTQAAEEECDITEKNGNKGTLTWSYAYYELAERGVVPGPDGAGTRFQGFLGEQATNLFDMTKRN